MPSTGIQEYGKHISSEDSRDPSRTQCAVSGALALVLRASRCAGVAPLRFAAAGAGWRVAVSPPLAVFQCILMTILNAVGVAAMVLDFYEEPKRRIRVGESEVTAFVWVADLLVVFAIASLAAYRGPARMEQLIHLLNQLEKINIDLNHDSRVAADKIGVIAVPTLLIYAIVIQSAEVYTMTRYFMHKGYNWSIMAMYSTYHASHILRLLVVLQWGFLVLAVHGSAATINRRLLRLFHVKLKAEQTAVLRICLDPPKHIVDCFTETNYDTAYSEFEYAAYPSQVQSTVRRLASSHGQLGELIRVMNENNGTLIMANLMAIFLHLVVIPYYLMLTLNTVEGLVRAAMHIAILLLTVEPCHLTHVERETTRFLLSRLIVRLAPRNQQLGHELIQFAKQTALTSAKFTPLGVLTLGRPLVASMFGGVATYLVILMQFYALTDE